jgi:NADH-quinone oxidoreductase subunit G
MARIDQVAAGDPADLRRLAERATPSAGGGAFGAAVADFYLTNPITRASAIMAEMSALAGKRAAARQAAE